MGDLMQEKNLNIEKVNEISKLKQEPEWMTEFRVNAYNNFVNTPNPIFGTELNIDFSIINYYKKITDKVHNSWEDVPTSVKDTFDKIGLPEAEQKYLAGVGAQFESEVIYHNMLKELEDKNVIFTSIEVAMKKYPELVKKYFGKTRGTFLDV